MSPRPYRLGKRAAAVHDTRARILEAALQEYAETGIADASMQSIARRADVAPGTVLYHYPDPDGLAEAVVARRAEVMDVPRADAVDLQAPVDVRVAALTAELFRVYADTDLDYQAWVRSREHPVMRRYETWYNDLYSAALTAALGEHATDPHVVEVTSALIDPGFRASLLMRGLSHEEAATEASALVVAWLERRTA